MLVELVHVDGNPPNYGQAVQTLLLPVSKKYPSMQVAH